MARHSLPSPASASDSPLRLADVDLVADDPDERTVVDGATVAALLDVDAAETDRLLDPEAISLEIDHVADLLGALAETSQLPAAGALAVAEQCLRRLASRVDGLRPGARAHARRWVVTRAFRETLAEYRARVTVMIGVG